MHTDFEFSDEESAELDLLLSQYLQENRVDVYPIACPPCRGDVGQPVRQDGRPMFAERARRRIISTGILLALLAGILAMSACNTWHGAGKDVERAGEKMQGK